MTLQLERLSVEGEKNKSTLTTVCMSVDKKEKVYTLVCMPVEGKEMVDTLFCSRERNIDTHTKFMEGKKKVDTQAFGGEMKI